MVYDITDDNFQAEVADAGIPCVIGFTASWCTMCGELRPMLDELSAEFEGEAKFCMVDTDENTKLRIKFAVAAMPYVVYVSGGQKTPLFDEVVTKERLAERVRFMLDGGSAPNTLPLR